MVPLRALLLGLWLLAGPAYTASAQAILYTFGGEAVNDHLGRSVSGAGDVDGDGVVDLVVGIPFHDVPLQGAGSARIYSGSDGSVLNTYHGSALEDRFGWSVSGAGDVNGDGLADVIVGAYLDDTNGVSSGLARIHFGIDPSASNQGTPPLTLLGNDAGDWFGWSVGGGGDANGDGLSDVIVGARHDDDNGNSAGSARLHKGPDGGVLFFQLGESAEEEFGYSVGSAGDVNADGFDDVIVGAWKASHTGNESGRARVLSGPDGAVLHTFDGDAAFDGFGRSVAGAGDVNRDGFDDVIVGAPRNDQNGANSGLARVFSGLDGSVLYTLLGDSVLDEFGTSVSGAGDVNGDGHADFVVGAPLDDTSGIKSGSARLFSGVDGRILHTWYGDASDGEFGISVSAAQDVNGDGFDDVIVGAPNEDPAGIGDAGRAWLFSGCDALGTTYCSPAETNSSGLPGVIRACGSDAVAENRLELSASDLPTAQFGYFITSQTQGFVQGPGGSQGNLCLGGAIGRFSNQVRFSGSSGEFGISVDLTNMPPPAQQVVLPGETWNFQAWFRDVNPVQTSNFTDAISILLQ